MEVVFSQRAIAAVMAETAEKIQTETLDIRLTHRRE